MRILLQRPKLFDQCRIFREIRRVQIDDNVTCALGVGHGFEQFDPWTAGLRKANERPGGAGILVQIWTEECLAKIGVNIEPIVFAAI
jgi:hypothetical protein